MTKEELSAEQLVAWQRELLRKGCLIYDREFTQTELQDRRKKVAIDLDGTLTSALEEEVNLVQLRPGAEDFLKKLKLYGCKLVLWTNSTKARAWAILQRFSLEPYFDLLIAREDYDLGEPSIMKACFPNGSSPGKWVARPAQMFSILLNEDINMKPLHLLDYGLLVDDETIHSYFAERYGFNFLKVDPFTGTYPQTSNPLLPDLAEQVMAILAKKG